MIVLGLLLILAALGAAMFAVMAPSAAAQTIEMSALGFKISASPLAMFVAGALSVVLIGLGFALIRGGARRKSSSRKELRDLRKGQAATDPQTPAEAGQHSSRRDRRYADTSSNPDTSSGSVSGTEADAGTHNDTGAGTGKSTAAGASTGTDPQG